MFTQGALSFTCSYIKPVLVTHDQKREVSKMLCQGVLQAVSRSFSPPPPPSLAFRVAIYIQTISRKSTLVERTSKIHQTAHYAG